MRNIKWLTPFILLFVTLIILSACGSSLQKPTGLEEDTEKQTENMKAAEANDKKENQARADEKEKEEDKQSEDQKKESDDKKEEKKSGNQKSTSNKKKNEEKSSASKSEQSSPDTKKKSSESNSDKTDKKKEKATDNKTIDKKSSSDKKETKKDNNDKKKPKPKPKEETDKNKSPPKDEAGDSKPPAKEEEPEESTKPKEPKNTVSFFIQFSSDKIILPSTKIEFEEGDSVMKILDQITRDNKIQISIRSTGYVSRIDNIGEKEHGAESGWMYSVNGVFPNVGAASYTLKDGDVVQWLYTLDLGKDLGAH